MASVSSVSSVSLSLSLLGPRAGAYRSPMDRRRFLEAGALGAAATLTPVGALLGAGPAAPTAASAAPPWARAAAQDFAFAEATVADLQAHMAAGRHSARAIAEAYLARIAALDHAGPTVRSVLEVNPEALAIADRLDAERRAGRVRGPLHGIAVLLKDNVAGSTVRRNWR